MLVFGVKKNSPSAQQSHFHSVCLTSPWSSRHRCSPINQLSKAIWGDTKFWLSFSPVLFFEMAEPLTCRFKTFRESDLWADLTFQLSFIFFSSDALIFLFGPAFSHQLLPNRFTCLKNSDDFARPILAPEMHRFVVFLDFILRLFTLNLNAWRLLFLVVQDDLASI